MTDNDLANMCGTSPDLISRMLNELSIKQIIAIEQDYITILDLTYLKRYLECSNCSVEICRID